MAGKHVGTYIFGTIAGGGGQRPSFPGGRVDRAYSEGRGHNLAGGLVGANPHVVGSAASNSWLNGFYSTSGGNQVTKQAQTCWAV